MIDIESNSLYAQYVETQAKTNSDVVFRNSGSTQAVITLTAIFKYAKEIVRMFSGGLDPEITSNDSYFDEVKRFLERNGKIRLMTEQQPSESSKVWQIIKEYESYEGDQVISKRGVGSVLSYGDKTIHLATSDNNGYRLELIPEKHIAEVCFHAPDKVKGYNQVFDTVFNKPR